MDKQEYALTDGDFIAETRHMTDVELDEAQRVADDATGGNWYWVRLDSRVWPDRR